MKRFLAVILTVSVLLGTLSVSFAGSAADNIVELSDIMQFETELESMISEENTKIQDFSNLLAPVPEAASNRLIVKANGPIDDMGAVSKVDGLLDLHIFQYDSPLSAKLAYTYYQSCKNVDWVEYDSVVESQAVEPTVNEEWLTFDGSKHLSWGADYLGIDSFISEIADKSLENVVVAVVDTGIDTDHPLFNGYYDPAANPNGRILKNGENFSVSQNDVPFEDDNGHGTHVCGTIVDLTLSNVKILPVKVLDMSGEGFNSSVALGIIYAAYSGADIINLSLGGGIDAESMISDYAIDIAHDAGALPVVAAGNDSIDTDNISPAIIEKCITVGAVNQTLYSSDYTNFGESVDVCAPGDAILSANMGGGYIYFDGTSMAAPHVSAVAALYLSRNASLNNNQLTQAIENNCIDLGVDGKDFYYGHGLAFAQANNFENLGKIDIKYSSKESVDTAVDVYFDEAVTVSLECENAAEIYYTTDGSNPAVSAAAKLYSGEFEIADTLKLRAIAYGENKAESQSLPLERKIYTDSEESIYVLHGNGNKLIGYTGILPLNFTVPEKYTSIGDYALTLLSDIESLTVPDSVTEIGEGAFMTTSFASVDLGSIKHIGKLAFANCSIEELIAPSVQSVGEKAFYFSVIYEGDLSGVKTVGNHAFDSAQFDSLNMPDVTEIGNNAFAFSAAWIDQLSFSSAKSIGDYAFYYSQVLYDADMPEATQIGIHSFNNANIYYVNMPLVEYAPDYAFANNYEVEINMPALTAVGEYAFAGAYVRIPQETLNNIETVGEYAFYTAVMPEKTVMPKLTYAGEFAFVHCDGWREASFPKLTYADEYAFYGSFFESVDVPELENCGKYAFAWSGLIGEVTMPKLKTVGDGAFEVCYFTKINLPSAETIGSRAFADGDVIAAIITDKVTYIGERAFTNTSIIGDAGSYAQQYSEKNSVNFVEKDTVFTVNFYNANGKVINSQQVAAGEAAVEPKEPFAFGQVFQWWDEDYTCVVSDLDVYPMYESIFTIIYYRIISFFNSIFFDIIY